MTVSDRQQTANMRAWQSTSPGLKGLQFGLVPRPQHGPREALVCVEAAALNFSDGLMIDDRYQVRPPRPFVPGQEVSGTVVAAGTHSGLAEGERIASKVEYGGFAEYAVVRGDMALRVPASMSMARAAALPIVYTTALVALTECTLVKPGETVLVLAAAGGIGLASVEIARDLEARVIAAAGGQRKCALAREHGAQETVDYGSTGWDEVIKEMTGGNGVDVIVDPVGGQPGSLALRLLARGGRLLIVGFSSGEIQQIPANRLLLRRASAIGVYWNHDLDGPMLAGVAERVRDLCERGAIRPHVETSLSFEELPDALAALAARETTGKAVIAMTSERRAS